MGLVRKHLCFMVILATIACVGPVDAGEKKWTLESPKQFTHGELMDYNREATPDNPKGAAIFSLAAQLR